MNLYSYVNSDPVNKIDYSGTGPVSAVMCAGATLFASVPVMINSAVNSYEISALENERNMLEEKSNQCPPPNNTRQIENINNKIEELKDQNRAADEYFEEIANMRAGYCSLILFPTP